MLKKVPFLKIYKYYNKSKKAVILGLFLSTTTFGTPQGLLLGHVLFVNVFLIFDLQRLTLPHVETTNRVQCVHVKRKVFLFMRVVFPSGPSVIMSQRRSYLNMV